MDAHEAASMLAAANAAQNADPVSQDAAPAAPASSGQPAESPSVEPGATAPDSFTALDPSVLPPEAQAFYKNMQADYTRKTQELAEQRKQYEGLDLDAARQAVQFVESLNSDPQYALQVHQQLSQALQQAGLTPAQADAAATQQMDAPDDEYTYAPDEYDGVPPEVKAQLQELQTWKQQQEAQQQEQYWMAELTRQEMAIRQANPAYTDSDMETVYALAHAHQGDLNKAAEQYAGLRNALVSQYIEQKAAVPSSGPPAQSGITPQPGMDFDQAHKAAQEHLNAVLGSQG